MKRTFSSPNIAKLDDADDLEIDEETEKKTIINSLTKPKVVEIKPSVGLKPTAETIKQPTVNRNSKPMPDHVMRARIDELQPVFGIKIFIL